MSSKVSKFGRVTRKDTGDEGVPLPFIVNNFLAKDGGELSGNIDMNGNFIKNLPDPVNGGDAVTKNYVDSSQGHSFFRRSPGKGYVASKNLNVNEQRLLNLAMPIDNLEAANKLYTDITTNDLKNRLEGNNPFFLNTDKHKARSGIDMQNFKLQGLPMPVDDKDTSNKIYVDTLTEDRRRKLEVNNPFTFDNGEYTAKGKINMKGFKIENVEDDEKVFLRKNGGYEAQDHIYLKNKKLGGLRDPVANREAVNKKYVDEENKKLKTNTLNKFGDGVNYEAGANFNLNNFRLFGVPDPTREDETANKKYVDEKTANLQPVAPGVDAAALDKVKTDLEKNQAFNTRNQKTFNARGNINMKQKTIRNIPDPVEVTDVVNKGYVDEMREFFEDRIKEVEDEAKEAKDAAGRAARAQPGGGVNSGNSAVFGDMKGLKLLNVGDPENSADGVNKKYVDAKTPFTKTNGYYTTSHGINMDFKKITNLNTPTGDGDATNKQYVDESINNIETGLLRKNGGFLAMDAIDMNTNRIYNIGKPQFETDAMPKSYVDGIFKPVEEQAKTNSNDIIKLKEEDRTRKTETDRIRVLITEKNKYIEEKIYKFLGTTLILVRGEIEGPIIGMDEVKNINRRKPTIDGGSISIDEEGNPVIPSIVYFGKNDGGEFSYDGKNGKIKIKPNFLFPYGGNILNCSYIFTYDEKKYRNEKFEIIFRLTESQGRGGGLHDHTREEQLDYSGGILDGYGRKKEYKNVWDVGNEGKILKTCIHPPYFDIINFTDCTSLILYFKSSHPKVLKGIITLVVQLHLSDYKEEYLPLDWNIINI